MVKDACAPRDHSSGSHLQGLSLPVGVLQEILFNLVHVTLTQLLTNKNVKTGVQGNQVGPYFVPSSCIHHYPQVTCLPERSEDTGSVLLHESRLGFAIDTYQFEWQALSSLFNPKLFGQAAHCIPARQDAWTVSQARILGVLSRSSVSDIPQMPMFSP